MLAEERWGERKERGVLVLDAVVGLGDLERVQAADEPRTQRTAATPGASVDGCAGDSLCDLRKDGLAPGRDGAAGRVDDGVAAVLQYGNFDGGIVGGVAHDDGQDGDQRRRDHGSELLERWHEDGHDVLVDEERGDQAQAQASRRADEEDAHCFFPKFGGFLL